MRDLTAPRPRPNSRWVCGYQRLGVACPGPDAKGQCGISKVGASGCDTNCGKPNCDTAKCETAVSKLALPCKPQRAGWDWPNKLALNLALLVGCGLLVLLALPQREAAFVPGGLSSKHAQILENQIVADRCSMCHPNSHTPQFLDQHGQAQPAQTQDQLCMRCHTGHLPNLARRLPHDLSHEQLVEMTTKQRERFRLVSKTQTGDEEISETNCATCHVEHHGREQDLKAIADARCQACHANQFASLSKGHPEFDNYPAISPRQIAFNHNAHRDKHFAQKNEQFECAQCHVSETSTSDVGPVFRTLGFEVACSRCHDEAIKATMVDGWVLMQIPSLEPQDASPRYGLSDWPAAAQFGYDGRIPLVMRELLSADPEVNDVLKRLPTEGDLRALSQFELLQSDLMKKLALATRRLVRDIASEGQAAWKQRLTQTAVNSLGRELEPSELTLIDRLCVGLPPDVFRAMDRDWFRSTSNSKVSQLDNPNHQPSLQARLISAQDDSLLLNDTSKPTNNQSADSLLGGDNLLRGQEDSLLGGDNLLRATSPTDDELLKPAPSSREAGNAGQAKPGQAKVDSKSVYVKLRAAVHIQHGGWFLDPETLSLIYKPTGHADDFLAAWSEFESLLARAPKQLSQIPGNCTQCHQLENQVSRQLKNKSNLNQAWQARPANTGSRPLTKFNHRPHLTLPSLLDCAHCHQLRSERVELVSKPSGDIKRLSSLDQGEFHPLRLESCSACHRPGGANDACIQCHNYHVH